MVYLVKVFPSAHKVSGEEYIAYVFTDGADDDEMIQNHKDALNAIIKNAEELGLCVDEEYARELVAKNGFLGLNRVMEYGTIEWYDEGVWGRD